MRYVFINVKSPNSYCLKLLRPISVWVGRRVSGSFWLILNYVKLVKSATAGRGLTRAMAGREGAGGTGQAAVPAMGALADRRPPAHRRRRQRRRPRRGRDAVFL
jgi:hypothetical protein